MTVWHRHHLVPRHAGGSDEPENILKCNVAMHAFLHKQLYEEHGLTEDYLAWKGLSGQMTMSEVKREAQKLGLSNGGKIGGRVTMRKHGTRISRLAGKASADARRKTYEITFPDGQKQTTDNLRHFCSDHGLCRANMLKIVRGKRKSHKGFTLTLLG